MNQLLKVGQQARTLGAARRAVAVGRYLGGGGQGEVYEATLDGATWALKWYFPEQATVAQRSILRTLIARGSPDARFLWPAHLVEADATAGFGYLMPLRPARFCGLLRLVLREQSSSFRALLTAGMNLADGFIQLHARGFSYGDISFGNVFLDPGTGEALICDNDNVVEEGSTAAGVLGTPDFMAPEIVRGEARPCTAADLYSLSVLLFYLCCNSHPLYGRRVLSVHCLDAAARARLCGHEPLFIFDPVDRSNEALSFRDDPTGEAGGNARLFWGIYPAFFRALFTRAFTDGLRDPAARVRESEWRKALCRLRDLMVRGPTGATNFFDPDSEAPQTCWKSGQPLALPPLLRLRHGNDQKLVALDVGAELFPHHLGGRDYDFSAPVARVVAHPQHPSVLGLENLTSAPWSATLPDGTPREVPPGKRLTLGPGIRVHFGVASGELYEAPT